MNHSLPEEQKSNKLTIICAWCERELGQKPDKSGGITHGLCPACKEEMLAEARKLRSLKHGKQ